jgi:serine protease Do
VRGYLGVSMQDISADLASEFHMDSRSGALVAEVVPDSPADKAGLKAGDVITQLDGKPAKDARQLKLAVANYAPGQKLKAELLREGKKMNVEIAVAARPSEQSLARGQGRGGRDFGAEDTGTLNGVGVGDLDPQTRREFDIPANIRGALVTSVEPDSPSAAAGLQPGDVIQEINRQPVTSADDAMRLTESAESKRTLLRVWSQRGSRYVVVDETDVPENR